MFNKSLTRCWHSLLKCRYLHPVMSPVIELWEWTFGQNFWSRFADFFEQDLTDTSEGVSDEASQAYKNIAGRFCSTKTITVNAGSNQTVALPQSGNVSIALSGSANTPNPGGISTYQWQFISAWSSGAGVPNIPTGTSPTRTVTIPGSPDPSGTYVFQLRATDARNVSGRLLLFSRPTSMASGNTMRRICRSPAGTVKGLVLSAGLPGTFV